MGWRPVSTLAASGGRRRAKIDRSLNNAGTGDRGVDFVVAGFGLGAVLVLIGFAVRDLGPLLHRSGGDESTAAWLAISVVGTALTVAGFAICLVTLIALAAGVADRAGGRAVALTAIVAVLSSVGWSLVAVRRILEGHAAVPNRIPRRSPPDVPLHGFNSPEARSQPALADLDPAPASTRPDAPDMEDAAQHASPASALAPMRDATEPRFQSPLLADVALDSPSAGAGRFRSNVLADLTFASPMAGPDATPSTTPSGHANGRADHTDAGHPSSLRRDRGRASPGAVGAAGSSG
jgi:hypothetical protein